jgi:tRNA U34 5-methylaminomethyl-2-thiouridine-forming methyltransferase MnmC
MERRIIKTADGSDTVEIPELNVSYHSKHGAIQESMHVFIESGFRYLCGHNSKERPDLVRIFEMGFGTGLNAFLTAIEVAEKRIEVYYEAIEQFPLRKDHADALNYTSVLNHEDLFQQIHKSKWNEKMILGDFFRLKKVNENLINYSTNQPFNIIYYDAFAPTAQPELWTEEVFKKLHSILLPGGVLVTYCSKGSVRRAMKAVGFSIEKIPGPPGKREMIRAIKA